MRAYFEGAVNSSYRKEIFSYGNQKSDFMFSVFRFYFIFRAKTEENWSVKRHKMLYFPFYRILTLLMSISGRHSYEFFLFEVLLDGYEQLWEWHIGSVGTLWSTQIIIFCISCSLLLSWIRNFNFVYAVFAVLNASLKKALETIKLRFN